MFQHCSVVLCRVVYYRDYHFWVWIKKPLANECGINDFDLKQINGKNMWLLHSVYYILVLKYLTIWRRQELLRSKAASESTFKKSNTCGYQIIDFTFYFFYFYKIKLCFYQQRMSSLDEVSKSHHSHQAAKSGAHNKPTIFSKIIDKTLPAKILFEDDQANHLFINKILSLALYIIYKSS